MSDRKIKIARSDGLLARYLPVNDTVDTKLYDVTEIPYELYAQYRAKIREYLTLIQEIEDYFPKW
jgi:hypothetical protein